MLEPFNNTVAKLNSRFSKQLWLDFEVISLSRGVLKIKASRDFCYYHNCEIEFSGMQYFEGPLQWGSDPQDGLMEVLQDTEVLELINRHDLDTPCVAGAFITDRSTKIIVAATAVKVNYDTVFYYPRDNLGPGERIDESVPMPGSGPK